MSTGTANNFRVSSRVMGPGIIWAGLSDLSASARMSVATVDADGLYTPLASEHAGAYAVGATKDGAVCMAKSTSQDYFVDEILAPVDRKLQTVEMSIQCSLVGLTDEKVTQLLMMGFGTYSTSSGYKQNTIGYTSDSFTGIALIAPLRADPTKVFVFHMYKAIAEGGIEVAINHKDMAAAKTTFKGYAVTTRALTDQIGNYWWVI
jgi:hypothetical protein